MKSASLVARTLIESSTRTWVYRRRLPDLFAGTSIFVTPSAGLKYLFRSMADIDPTLLRNVSELVRPGDVVWDIGANVGLFAFSAAVRAGHKGRVIAFEPDIWLVQLLRKSAAIQPETSAPVSIVATAVASSVSLQSMMIASRSRASNALAGYGYSQMGSVSETQVVVTLNLDWLAARLPAPNVIKCDVEGAELEVFAGQTDILDRIRPVIICEVGAKTSVKISDIFTTASYRLYDGEQPLSPDAEVIRASWNTVAIPEERLQSYLT